MAEWGVYVRDRDRRLVAALDGWTSLEATVRYNDVGAWQLTTPVSAAGRHLATAGNGVIIKRGAHTLLSGPVTSYTEQWGQQDPGLGTLVVTGRDDLIDLARNVAEPDPLVAGAPTQAYDRLTGPAETVIRGYVDRNIGTAAKDGRTRHRLGQTTDLGLGSTVTGNARWDNLLDLVRTLAASAGLGFRVVQDAGGITPLFDVYEPSDRSGEVVFSRTGGSLLSYSYTLSAPTVTRALVAGQGEGVARTTVEVVSTTLEEDWDVVCRVLIDRRDTDNADGELTQEAVAAIVEGGATAGLAVEPVDLPGMAYGVDYGLGDRVSVDIDETTRVTDVLTAVTISATADQGEVLRPQIGAGETGEIPALFGVLRRLGTRVGLLERRV